MVDLVAPDGTVFNLLNRSDGSADNVDQTFSVNLSGEVANGTWNLRVRDAAAQDTGFINSWKLSLCQVEPDLEATSRNMRWPLSFVAGKIPSKLPPGS